MLKRLIPSLAAASAALLMPFAASADPTPTSEITYAPNHRAEVLAAQAIAPSKGLIPVVDDTGRVYYNRIVDVEALPKADADLNIVDTYTFEHEGRVYTNQIVANSA